MSAQSQPRLRAQLWPGQEIEGVEVDREPTPSYNDRDAERVVVETEEGARYAVRGEDVIEEL